VLKVSRKMKIKSAAVAFLLIIGALISVATEDRAFVCKGTEGNINVSASSFHIMPILWGEMDAQVDKPVVQIERYGSEIEGVNITYQPYFIQFFPVMVNVSVVRASPWLKAVPSVKEFIIQRGETRTINIVLAVNEDVDNGTNGLVMLEICGRNLILPSLLDIAPARISFAVVKVP